MKRLIWATAALLSGCVSVPAELRDHGIHLERTSQHAPAAATRCIGRNAELESSAIVNYPLTDGGARGIDIYTRAPGESVRTIVAIRTRPAGTGTIADVWIAPGAYAAPHEFAQRLVGRC